MSQQGFPGNFIMPDDTGDFPYSNLIVSKQDIESEVRAWAAQSFDESANNQIVSDTTLGSLNGLVSAALVLAQFYIQQITFQGAGGPGTTFENAREIPFDEESKCKLLNNLGNNSSPGSLFSNYEGSRYRLDGVENIFFNLGFSDIKSDLYILPYLINKMDSQCHFPLRAAFSLIINENSSLNI